MRYSVTELFRVRPVRMGVMNDEILQRLNAIAGAGNVLTGEPMSAHTTFRTGGPADFFVTPDSVEAACGVTALCRERELPIYVMGRGSNLLVADEGLRGVVMQLGSKLGGTEVTGEGHIRAQAGAMNSLVARTALDAGLSGFEFAAGIPGTIGGAAIMNAGAYDGELKNVATGVTCLTTAGDIIDVPASETGWGYRCSKMADDGSIVLAVDLQLSPGDPDEIRAHMAELARRRAEKQPLDLPSAGSTFKRPPGHFAGKLIQDAGMQGHAVGGAQVSTKHAGFVVNTGGATASDIMQVIEDVQAAVLAQFGVELEPEIRRWGF